MKIGRVAMNYNNVINTIPDEIIQLTANFKIVKNC